MQQPAAAPPAPGDRAALVDRLAADPNDGEVLRALAEHHAAAGRPALAEACRRRAEALQRARRGGHPEAGHEPGSAAVWPVPEAAPLTPAPPEPTAGGATGDAGGLGAEAARQACAQGIALIRQGELDQAIALLGRLLQAMPDDAEALNARGAALLGKKNYDEAERMLRRALELQPGHGEAWTNLGFLHQRRKQMRPAIAAYREALKALPDEGRVHNNLGTALEEMDELEEAQAHFARAVELLPHYGSAYSNLGRAMLRRGKMAEARRLLERAVELQAGDDAVWLNMATLLQGETRYEEAEAAYRKALTLNPERAETWANLGNLLKDQGDYEGSIRSLERALELDPEMDVALSNLIFTRDFDPAATVQAQQEERSEWHRRFGARHAGRIQPHDNDPDPERPLVLGYVSADFKRHSAEIAFGPVLRAHDRSRHRLIVYSSVDRPDRVTAEYERMADAFHNCLRMTDDEMAEQIRRDRVDILVDLSGHTAGHRLAVFARKPAPVQAHAWGHVGTGLPTIDYYMSDPVLVRPEERRFYAEEVHDLPAPICYQAPEDAPAVGPPPLQANGHVTFGCLNRISKLSARTAECWAQILHALPQTRLVLKDRTLDDATQQARVSGWFTGRGIDAGRLTLLPGSGHLEHMAAYNRIDIALDPFPQGGGITTCEALWMGVPVVALMGNVPSSRIASAIVCNVGLPELVAESPEAYVARALALAGDPAKLAAMRARLRQVIAAAPIGDIAAYTRAVETAYRGFWRRWCASRGAG